MSAKSRFGFGGTGLGDGDAGEDATASPNEAKKRRLGPMAAAVRDAGDANRAAGGNTRLDELETLELAVQARSLREAALDLRVLPLGEIDEAYLQRDRQSVDRDGLEELKASIREKGLGAPIRVDLLADGRYGLNQGRRRLLAFRELHEETGEDRFAAIPAFVDREQERESAYRRMVDENLIREDVSLAELAALAISYGSESGVSSEDAVQRLFASANRNRRWTIGEFVKVLDALGERLKHPQAINRDLGRSLARRIAETGGIAAIAAALDAAPERGRDQELAILEAACAQQRGPSRGRVERNAPPRKLRVFASGQKGRRVDVSISEKRIVISGKDLSRIPDEAVRAAVLKLFDE
jgi:ParB family chromosome partitioning protein